MKITKKDLQDQEVQFSLVAEQQDIENAREQALIAVGQEINVPGFRKGHAPTTEIIKRVGETRLLQEIVEAIIEEGYRQVLHEYDVFPLTTPKIDLTDNKAGDKENPELSFTITVTSRPTPELPDYKALDVTYEEPVVTPEQAEEALKELFERWKADVQAQQEEKPVIETATTIEQAKQKAEDVDEIAQKNQLIASSKEQPDDEWAALLGATDMEDLKQKLQANLILEKHYLSGNKFTQDTVDKLIDGVKVDLPKKLIQEDLEKRITQKEEDLEKIGLNLESFANQHKKTVEELRKEWLEDMEREYILEFALAEIAKKEDITVSDEEVQQELKASKSADSLKLFQDPDRREHLRYLIRRDKIIRNLVEWNMKKDNAGD